MPIYEGTIGGVRFCVEAFEVTTNENAVGAQGRAMFGIVRGELLENAPYIKVGGFASDANAFGELEHEDTIEFDVTLKVRGAPAAGTLEVGLIQNVLATKRDANYGDQRVFKTDEGSVLLDCVPAREPWFASKPKSLDASVVSDAQESTVELYGSDNPHWSAPLVHKEKKLTRLSLKDSFTTYLVVKEGVNYHVLAEVSWEMDFVFTPHGDFDVDKAKGDLTLVTGSLTKTISVGAVTAAQTTPVSSGTLANSLQDVAT